MEFPALKVRDLEGVDYVIPDELPGGPHVIILAFQQWHQVTRESLEAAHSRRSQNATPARRSGRCRASRADTACSAPASTVACAPASRTPTCAATR